MLEAQRGMPTLTDATVAAGIAVTAGLLLAATRPREQQVWDWLVDASMGGNVAGILLSSFYCKEQQVWDWLVDAGMGGDAVGILFSFLHCELLLLSFAHIRLHSRVFVCCICVCREQQVWDWLVDAGMSGDTAGILLSSLQVSLSVLLLLSLLSLAQIIFARVTNPTKPPFSSSFSASFPLPASPFTSSPYEATTAATTPIAPSSLPALPHHSHSLLSSSLSHSLQPSLPPPHVASLAQSLPLPLGGRRKQVETKEELQQLLMNLDGKMAAAAAAVAFAAGGSDGEGVGGGAGAEGGDGRGIVGGRGRAGEGPAAAAARGGGGGAAGERGGGDYSASYPSSYYQFQPEYFDRLPPISPRTLADSLVPTTPNIPRSSSPGASASPLPPSSFSPASPLRSSSPPPFSTPSHRHTHTDATAPFLTTPHRYTLPSSLSTPAPSTDHSNLYQPSFTFPRSSLPFDTVTSDAVTSDNAPSSPLLVHPRLTPSPSRAAIVRKKGEVERLKPMLPEEEEEGFKRLGVLQWRDTWRDGIRQWFSQHLLRALVKKIEAAPSKLAAAAAPLGLSLSLEPLHSLGNSAVPPPAGSAALGQTSTPGSAGVTAGGSSGLGVGGLGGVEGGGVEEVGGGGRVVVVQGSVMGEREGLQQVKGVLLQLLQSASQAAPPAGSIFGLHQPQQQQQQQQLEAQKEAARSLLAAIADYEHLRDVLRGHWAKGLLPRGSMPLEYSTQRIKALAAGSCLRCFQWSAGGSFLTRDSTRIPTPGASSPAPFPSEAPSSPLSSSLLSTSLPSSVHPHSPSRAPSSPAPSTPSSLSTSQPSSISYSLQAAPEGVYLVPWTPDLPTDAHLLLYLFAAHLSHPHWLDEFLQSPLSQQQQQQISAAGATVPAAAASLAAQNPLLVGGSLPRDRLLPLSASSSSQSPSALLGGRFTAIVGSIPPANARLPPGADMVVITRDAPPVFVLFWEGQPSFCLQPVFSISVAFYCDGARHSSN
ncbi:unnamed protein product [Closterium sp. Naga37s-1]|nr:unnamed protein product [Closterium sp. Naga37s-1]